MKDSVRPLVVPNGTLEAIKWAALVLMTLDHVNKFLYAGKLSVAFALGRIVLPLFCFVLAYNLARPGTLESGAYPRTIRRLALFGAIAAPVCMALGGLLFGWWPLNIMFTLAVATAALYYMQKGGHGRFVAFTVVLVAGLFVEYWWFALAVCLAAFWYCKTASKTAFAALALAIASLWVINGNWWALAALPVVLVAPLVRVDVPRVRWVFYAFYPAHLAVILAIKLWA